MLDKLFKAEYLFRPTQLLRRGNGAPASGLVEARLPWGRTIRVSTRDNIGPQVLVLGIYDLVVAETLWRLTDDGDIALDVGANIGCMTAVLGERVGVAGVVHSFEPHPVIFSELSANIDSLRAQGVPARFEPKQLALGETPGTLPLNIPEDFELHRGESSLAAEKSDAQRTIDVCVSTLDDLFRSPARVGLMKMDVEGFEQQVLLGAKSLLSEQRLRDCVFEEHRAYPSAVTAMFESKGYRIFRLARGFLHPRLLAGNSTEPRSTWEATSFLATTQPDRSAERLRGFGWRALRR